MNKEEFEEFIDSRNGEPVVLKYTIDFHGNPHIVYLKVEKLKNGLLTGEVASSVGLYKTKVDVFLGKDFEIAEFKKIK